MPASWLWDSSLIHEVLGRDHQSRHSTEHQPHLPASTHKDKVSRSPHTEASGWERKLKQLAQAEGLTPQGKAL